MRNDIKPNLLKKLRFRLASRDRFGDLCTFHVSQGDAHNARKEWPAAIEHYKQALSINPALTAIWIQLGHGQRETGLFEDAEQSYLRALEIDSDDQDAKFFLGVTREELARTGEAKQELAPVSTPDELPSETPGEPPSEAPEPPEFRFCPTNLPFGWTRPQDWDRQEGSVIVSDAGQALGVVSTLEAADDIAATLHAFRIICCPWLIVAEEERIGAAKPVNSLSFGAKAGFGLADVWFANRRMLRLRFEPDQTVNGQFRVLRCFQRDPGDLQRLQLLAEQPVATDLATFIDVVTANPYFPLLMSVCTEAGEILAVTLLPFPSLCRGGLHFGELLAAGGGKPYLRSLEEVSGQLLGAALRRENGFGICRVEVDLDGAVGTERIFDPALRKWLTSVVGISIGVGRVPLDMHEDVRTYLTAAVTSEGNAAVSNEESSLLRVPADAVPSLQSIFGGDDQHSGKGQQPAAFVLASSVDGVPKWLLSPPLAGSECANISAFPSLETPRARNASRSRSGADEGVARAVAAIRFRRLSNPEEAQLLAPSPFKAGDGDAVDTVPAVSVVHNFSGNKDVLAAVLQSLALQSVARGLEVLVAGNEADASSVTSLLDRLFPSRGRFVSCPAEEAEGARLARAVAEAEKELLLFLTDTVLLHDPRTVACLASLIEDANVASASCMLVGLRNANKTTKFAPVATGLFPLFDHSDQLTAARYVNGDILLALPPGVWPAALSSSRLFLVRRSEWERTGSFAERRAGTQELTTPFWSASASQGKCHLVTTAISACLLATAGGTAPALQLGTQSLPSFHEAVRVALTVRRLVA